MTYCPDCCREIPGDDSHPKFETAICRECNVIFRYRPVPDESFFLSELPLFGEMRLKVDFDRTDGSLTVLEPPPRKIAEIFPRLFWLAVVAFLAWFNLSILDLKRMIGLDAIGFLYALFLLFGTVFPTSCIAVSIVKECMLFRKFIFMSNKLEIRYGALFLFRFSKIFPLTRVWEISERSEPWANDIKEYCILRCDFREYRILCGSKRERILVKGVIKKFLEEFRPGRSCCPACMRIVPYENPNDFLDSRHGEECPWCKYSYAYEEALKTGEDELSEKWNIGLLPRPPISAISIEQDEDNLKIKIGERQLGERGRKTFQQFMFLTMIVIALLTVFFSPINIFIVNDFFDGLLLFFVLFVVSVSTFAIAQSLDEGPKSIEFTPKTVRIVRKRLGMFPYVRMYKRNIEKEKVDSAKEKKSNNRKPFQLCIDIGGREFRIDVHSRSERLWLLGVFNAYFTRTGAKPSAVRPECPHCEKVMDVGEIDWRRFKYSLDDQNIVAIKCRECGKPYHLKLD